MSKEEQVKKVGDTSEDRGPGQTPLPAVGPSDQGANVPIAEEIEEVPWLILSIEGAQKRLRERGFNLDDFDVWLRTQCFQAPTREAYDLAKAAWNFRVSDRRGGAAGSSERSEENDTPEERGPNEVSGDAQTQR